jgi:hypothetical protein
LCNHTPAKELKAKELCGRTNLWNLVLFLREVRKLSVAQLRVCADQDGTFMVDACDPLVFVTSGPEEQNGNRG